MTIKLSIIIPHLNYGRYLRKCLESVLTQTFKQYEVILVDGGSTDNTYEILKDYPMVKVLRDVPPTGPVRAVNKAIATMKGEYFAQLNSDCYLHPTMYEECVGVLEENENLGMVYTSWYIIDDTGKLLGMAHQPTKLKRQILLNRNYIDSTSMVIRRTCFDLIGTFDERCPLSMDWLMAAKLTKFFEVAYLNKPLFYYRVHAGQITQNPKSIADNRRAKQIMRAYFSRRDILAARMSQVYGRAKRLAWRVLK